MMAHFAEIVENNIVIRVLVIDNKQENRGQDFLANDLGLGGRWIQTSYNTNGGVHSFNGTPLRKNYAGIGFSFDQTLDAFVPPKCHELAELHKLTCLWVCEDASHDSLDIPPTL